ncbi:hypothetical protein, partial [Saccharothrix hoggarensis]
MTTSKSYSAVVDLGTLGPLGEPLSKDDGESLEIVPLVRDPLVLFKRYRPERCVPAEAERLDRLIALPRRLGADDVRRLREASCWPLSRVVRGTDTVGVLIPRAPTKFGAALTSLTGVGDVKPLAVDWLAKTPEQQATRGLPRTTFAQRLRVCQDIAAVAAILERESVVYADWSYANALWSPTEFRGYLIDVDGCSFGQRPWVKTVNWEDPLTPQGVDVDNYTDRFRLALLVIRCLSGERDIAPALEAVLRVSAAEGKAVVGQTLNQVVTARRRTDRPSVARIRDALSQSGTSAPGAAPADPNGHVVGWKPVGRAAPARPSTPTPGQTRPAPAAPRPA